MKRLLFLIHRWTGVALALFMLLWFVSGLLIVYATQLNQNRAQQWAHAQTLAPEKGWLSVGEALQRAAVSGDAASIQEARLQRIAGQPAWLLESLKGEKFALSAIDGASLRTGSEDALRIAGQWAAAGGSAATPRLVETVDNPTIVRNQDALRPFHRVALDDGRGSELYISVRTGEVAHASTTVERALYWAGNWVHLFRFLDLAGLDKQRVDVLLWLAAFALLSTLTGLIVGWLRWRPGWFGKATYNGGRVHPYKQVWFTWHFWAGLIGGIVTLTWTLSAWLNGNPWQIFSPANPTKAEYARYVGKETPRSLLDWRPAPVAGTGEVVELSLRHLGSSSVLVAGQRDGSRLAVGSDGIGEAAALHAVARLAGTEGVGEYALQNDYDNYYYPRHGRGLADRPLPVLKVSLGDQADTRFYVDPLDGRLLLRQDDSRRAYRWLWSALHHWDIAGLYIRPLWDAWMLTWIGFGLVLSVTSVVLGWRRLKVTVKRKGARPEEDLVLAPEGQGG